MKKILIIICLILSFQEPMLPQVAPLPEARSVGELRDYLQVPGFTRISFELVDGIVLVQAQLNGRRGSFILDTGAPTLIVNGQNFHEADTMLSLTQSCTSGETRVKSFVWGGLEQRDVQALVMDISHLEAAFGRDLLGVIGYRMFADRPLLVDTRKRVLYLARDAVRSMSPMGTPLARIPFTLEGHVPIVQVSMGSSTYRFAIDSGCSINVVDRQLLEPPHAISFTLLPGRKLRGFGAAEREMDFLRIDAVQVGNLPSGSMDCMVVDLSPFQSNGLDIQGLLGFPFVEGSIFSLDYEEGHLTFWELGSGISQRSNLSESAR